MSGLASTTAGAKRSIDAGGRVESAGFIDHHTHFDPQALWDPYCGSSVQNGHTTILVGQCGQVIAPARPGDHDWYFEFFAEAEAIPMSVMRQGIDFTWEFGRRIHGCAGQTARLQCGHAGRPFGDPTLRDGRSGLGTG